MSAIHSPPAGGADDDDHEQDREREERSRTPTIYTSVATDSADRYEYDAAESLSDIFGDAENAPTLSELKREATAEVSTESAQITHPIIDVLRPGNSRMNALLEDERDRDEWLARFASIKYVPNVNKMDVLIDSGDNDSWWIGTTNPDDDLKDLEEMQ